MPAHVLIADDDIVVRDVVRRYLERDGMTVTVASDGGQALDSLTREQIDVAVLDVMMPGPDGLTLCRQLSDARRLVTSVILLTALGEEDDRIAGLEAGADDYLTKPFSPRELVLRVRSVLRRMPAVTVGAGQELRSGSLTVSTRARSVICDGASVSLTNREFDLLVFLLGNTGTVFTRAELLKKVWGWEFGDMSTVTVHVKRLRAKLGVHHRIQTVWGRGYCWRDGAS